MPSRSMTIGWTNEREKRKDIHPSTSTSTARTESHSIRTMIFDYVEQTLFDRIQLIVEYHQNEIQLSLQWSPDREQYRWLIPYLDDSCTFTECHSLSSYLCSSSSCTSSSFTDSLFYSSWFLIDPSLYQRLFSTNENERILLLCLSDGRILALPEYPKTFDIDAILWYVSSSPSVVTLVGTDYDLNPNLVDAVLASASASSSSSASHIGSKKIFNHFIICESIGSILIINSTSARRVLLDQAIQSACIYAHQLVYITRHELRSIRLSALFQTSKTNYLDQSQILRLGHFERVVVDGQELILYLTNGTFERLTNLYARSNPPSRFTSLSQQMKKLKCLTSTMMDLQCNVSQLQRERNKLEQFYQLNLRQCLHFASNHWKLNLSAEQSRLFQTNDFYLILLCRSSSSKVQIFQLVSSQSWKFFVDPSEICTSLCQPILFLRHRSNGVHYQFASPQILLGSNDPGHFPMETPLIEHCKFVEKKSVHHAQEQLYHLSITIRNGPAKKFLEHLDRIRSWKIARVQIECKQQEIKVDSDAGLIDSLHVQITISSHSIEHLLIVYSVLSGMFEGGEEKGLIKQSDIGECFNRIETLQTNLSSDRVEENLFSLLQIRLYLSLYRLGSNYTVQIC